MKTTFSAILCLLILTSFQSFAQVPYAQRNYDLNKTYKAELRDGMVIVGQYISHDSLKIVLKTQSIDRAELSFSNISSIEEVPPFELHNGTYWFKNPHDTRYLFSPTAFNLKKGEGYYQNTYLFLNSVNVGVTDHISVGGGVEILSLFAGMAGGEIQPIFYLTPKASFKVADKLNAGAGLLYISVPGFFDDERSGFGIGYGMATYGTPDKNVTVAAGWGFSQYGTSSTPVVTASGMTRVTRRMALVSENWIIPSGTGQFAAIYSYGFRFFGEKMAVDLAFLNNSELSSVLAVGIPYVDFTIKF